MICCCVIWLPSSPAGAPPPPSGELLGAATHRTKAEIERLLAERFPKSEVLAWPGHGRPSTNPRHIPARVRRQVWERDGGQCTFVSEAGYRCEACMALEFDHVLEVERGGEASVDGIRLRCRAHNQYGAERAFGAEFMRHKRIAAREAGGASVGGPRQHR